MRGTGCTDVLLYFKCPVTKQMRCPVNAYSKLTDVDGENSETDTWLNFARDCGYISAVDYDRLTEKCRSVGKMIGSMLKNPESFLLRL